MTRTWASARDRKAPSSDPVAKERANMQHWLLEKSIVDLCLANHIVPLTNRHIDLCIRSKPTSVIFEMKSCALLDIASPVRRAVCQLLEYRYLYSKELGSSAKLCIVSERRPRASYEWLMHYLEHLAIGLIWRNDGDDDFSCSDFTKILLADVLPQIKDWKTKPVFWKWDSSNHVSFSPAVRKIPAQ
jgi:hypothetical protein